MAKYLKNSATPILAEIAKGWKPVLLLILWMLIPLSIFSEEHKNYYRYGYEDDEGEEDRSTKSRASDFQILVGQGWGGGEFADLYSEEYSQFFHYANLFTTRYDQVRYAEYYNLFLDQGPYVKKTNNIKISFKGTDVGNYFSMGISFNYSRLVVTNVKKNNLYPLYFW